VIRVIAIFRYSSTFLMEKGAMAAADISAFANNRADPAASPRIEWVPIGQPRPNLRNARMHSRKQIRGIAASIKKFGFLNPVLVDDADIVLAGHGRLEAARLEGLTHVPIIRFDHLTAAQKRAYLIADNKIAEQAGWDREILAIELGELIDLLPAEGFDVSLTGFEAPEIDLLLADMAPARPEPDDILPALPRNPVTRRGDLWRLGKHRILCGDAQEAADFARLMEGALASVVFCDPPYPDVGAIATKTAQFDIVSVRIYADPEDANEFMLRTVG
jgi:ParB-like nuclease domain